MFTNRRQQDDVGEAALREVEVKAKLVESRWL